jgi:moderate conductance mechanosensitive channel
VAWVSCFYAPIADVGVAYKESVDDVMELLQRIGAELKADPEFAPAILAPLEVLGVDNFRELQVTIKIRIKTLPHQQWAAGRELRRDIHGQKSEALFHSFIYYGATVDT